MSTRTEKVYLVTGSNSGIGKATVLGLAEKGASVVMVVRNKEKGETTRQDVIKQTGNSNVDLMICDLASMAAIRQFTKSFKEQYDRLDALINNAGAVINKYDVTPEGFERTLAVNYLAPFLLTHDLLPLLKETAPSRVINVSSGLHKSGALNFDELQHITSYSGQKRYRDSKLMIVLFTYALARRLSNTSVTANVLQPGFVATNLGRNSGSRLSHLAFALVRPFQLSPSKGAETSIYLASSSDIRNVTGKYFSKCQETSSAPISYIIDLQERLWRTTEQMLAP